MYEEAQGGHEGTASRDLSTYDLRAAPCHTYATPMLHLLCYTYATGYTMVLTRTKEVGARGAAGRGRLRQAGRQTTERKERVVRFEAWLGSSTV